VDRGAGQLKGRKRGVRRRPLDLPGRGDFDRSPLRIFFSFARSSPISTNARGCSSRSHGTFRERTPVCPMLRHPVRRGDVRYRCRTSRTHPPAAPVGEHLRGRVRPLLRHQVLLDGALEGSYLGNGPSLRPARRSCHASARMMYGFFPSFSSPIGATARRDVLPTAKLPVGQTAFAFQ